MRGRGSVIRRWIALLLCSYADASAGMENPVPSLMHRSYELEQVGDTTGALDALGRVPVDRRDAYFYQLRLGWLHYQSGSFDASAVAYRRAAERRPEAVEPLLGLLQPLIANRAWTEAEKVAVAALEHDAHNYLAESRLAFVLFSQGRYAEAAKTYRSVLALYPADLEMRAGLGWSLARQGRLADAEREFGAILEVAPASENARSGLEYIRGASRESR